MIFDKGANHSIGKGQFFKQMVFGKLNAYVQKNKVGPLPYTVYRY